MVVNAVLFGGAGVGLMVWPVEAVREYVTEDMHESVEGAAVLVKVLARLVACCLWLLAVLLLVSCVRSIASPAMRRTTLALACAAELSTGVLLSLSCLADRSSFKTTAVAVVCGVPVFAMCCNCAVLIFDVFCQIRERPDPPLRQHAPAAQSSTLNATHDDIEDQDEGAPLLDEEKDDDDDEDKEEKEEEHNYGWKRLLALARPESRLLAAGCIALLIRLPFSLAVPHFVAESIGCLTNDDYSGARFNVLLLMGAGTVDAVLDFWNFYLFGYAQQRLVKRLRGTLYRTFLRQEVGYYDATSSGDATSRLQVDTAEMGNDLTWVFRWTIESLGRIVGITVYMFVREWRLALSVIAVIPLCAAVGKVYGDWLQKNAEKVQTSLAASNSVAQEVLSAVRTVYSFHNQEHEAQRYDKEVDTWYKLNVKQVFMQALYYMTIATFLINTCVQAVILIYGVYLVKHHDVSTTVLLAFMLYQAQLQQWVSSLLNCFTNLIKSTGAGAKVFKILDRQVQMLPPTNPAHGAITDTAVISFQDVHFQYPTRKEAVLKGITLEAEPGKVIALVGLSGAGKSTLFHLLERFYEPSAGRIMLGGVDIGQIAPEEIHSKIAIVGQEPVLFSGSVFENIVYSVLGEGEGEGGGDVLCAIQSNPAVKAAFMQRVRTAADIANATEFIERLPKGFESEVGEKGVMLSGGQKQRIAIARAMMQDPKVCVI